MLDLINSNWKQEYQMISNHIRDQLNAKKRTNFFFKSKKKKHKMILAVSVYIMLSQ